MANSTTAVDGAVSAFLPPYSASRSQWWLVVVLTLISTLAAIDRQVLALFVDAIKADLTLTDVEIGLLLGVAFAVTGLLVGPVAGYFADRTSRRAMFGVSALLWSVAAGLCGLSSSFAQLFGARAALGLFEGVITPVSASMLRDAIPTERRGRAFGVVGMSPMIGGALALLGGGALAGAAAAANIHSLPLVGELRPWQLVFIAFGLFGIPIALLMLTVTEPLRGTSGIDQRANETVREGARYVLQHWKIYLPLMAFSVLLGMLSLSYGTWAPAMVGRTWGLSPIEIGLTFGSLMLVFAPVGAWLSGTLIDRVSRQRKDGAALVGISVTVVIWIVGTLMPIAPSPTLFWILMAVLLLFSATAFPVSGTLMAMVTPSRAMGKVMALQVVVTGLTAAVIAPSVIPALSTTFFDGEPRALGLALSTAVAVYGFLALVAILFVLRNLRSWNA